MRGEAGAEAPATAEPPAAGARPWLGLGALVGLALAGALAAWLTPVGDVVTGERADDAVRWLRSTPWAPLAFVAGWTLATALALPGTPLTLLGGAAFGFAHGAAYNWIGANVGASVAFLLARRLGRDGVRRLAGRRLDALDRAAEAHGAGGLLALRLIPLVPFNALNVAAGLTGLPWRVYAVVTAVGILPGTVVYTGFADALLRGSREASRGALLRIAAWSVPLLLLAWLACRLRGRGAGSG